MNNGYNFAQWIQCSKKGERIKENLTERKNYFDVEAKSIFQPRGSWTEKGCDIIQLQVLDRLSECWLVSVGRFG